MSGHALAKLAPQEPECPMERAAWATTLAIADFYIAVQMADTVDEALSLRALIGEIGSSVQLVERAAANRADYLCDKQPR